MQGLVSTHRAPLSTCKDATPFGPLGSLGPFSALWALWALGPLGPFGPFGILRQPFWPFGPLQVGPFGPFEPLGPLGPKGPLALVWSILGTLCSQSLVPWLPWWVHYIVQGLGLRCQGYPDWWPVQVDQRESGWSVGEDDASYRRPHLRWLQLPHASNCSVRYQGLTTQGTKD